MKNDTRQFIFSILTAMGTVVANIGMGIISNAQCKSLDKQIKEMEDAKAKDDELIMERFNIINNSVKEMDEKHTRMTTDNVFITELSKRISEEMIKKM